MIVALPGGTLGDCVHPGQFILLECIQLMVTFGITLFVSHTSHIHCSKRGYVLYPNFHIYSHNFQLTKMKTF